MPLITLQEERSTVNSLFDLVSRGSTVLNPMIAGAFILFMELYVLFAVSMACFILTFLKLKKINVSEFKTSDRKSLRKGCESLAQFFTWAKNDSMMRLLFPSTFMVVFFYTWTWQVGLLLALHELTQNGEEYYTFLQGIFGAVVVIANIVIPIVFKHFSIKTYAYASLLWGIGMLGFGLFYNVPGFIFSITIVGLSVPFAGLARVYILQHYVPESMHGRGFSANAVLLYASNTLSLLLIGYLASYVEIASLMLISAVLMLLSSFCLIVIITIKRPKVRRSDAI